MEMQHATTRSGLLWPTIVAGLLSFIILTFAVLAGPADAAATAERPSEFTLANGLKIVVVPDHRVPIVTHMVFYKIGSVDEGPGEEGLAHYLEHLMFLGTAKYPKGEFDRFVMFGGGFHNASTKQDMTTYYQRMPRDALSHLMELEADRMENLNFNENAAINERSVVMEEYRGKAGQPGFPFFHATARAMYGEHPYSLSPIGNEAGIAQFDGAKALKFYRRHYSPARAIVVIGGDVTEAEVRQLAETTYARVTAKPDTEAEDHPLPKLAAEAQRVVVTHPRVSAVSVSRSYLVESASEMTRADTTALALFTYIAADGVLSRMHRELVEPGISSGASGSFQLQRYAGQVTFDAAAMPGVPVEVIEAAFDKVLAELAANGVTETEFADMKQRFLATRVYDEDNTAQRSESIGSSMISGWQLDDLLDFKPRIEAITLDDVNRVGRGVLQGRRSVTGILVPEPAKPAPVTIAN